MAYHFRGFGPQSAGSLVWGPRRGREGIMAGSSQRSKLHLVAAGEQRERGWVSIFPLRAPPHTPDFLPAGLPS